MSNLTVKYIGKEPTLVRSFWVKKEVKKWDTIEVTEREYNNLRGSYKGLFEFGKSEDKKKDEWKKVAQKKLDKEEVKKEYKELDDGTVKEEVK